MNKKSSSERHKQKKQHFVPKCYLKAWLDPTIPKTPNSVPKLWLLGLDGSNPKDHSPKSIFRESEMYTLTALDGSRDLRLENGLGTLESKFSSIRNSKFNFERPLTDEEWMKVCLFAATLHTRTKVSRDHFLGQMNQMKSMLGEGWEELPEVPLEERDPNAYYPRPGDFDNLKEETTEILLRLAVTAIVPRLMSMQKTILCTDDPIGFITSDNPSTWFDPTAYRRPPLMRGVGLNHLDIEITLPISPRQCLVFTHFPALPMYTKISSEGLDILNHRHAGFAPNYIVSRSKEAKAVWFENGPEPEDSWEKLNPKSDDGYSWTHPDCPTELR